MSSNQLFPLCHSQESGKQSQVRPRRSLARNTRILSSGIYRLTPNRQSPNSDSTSLDGIAKGKGTRCLKKPKTNMHTNERLNGVLQGTPGLHDSDTDDEGVKTTAGIIADAENTKLFLTQAATGNVFFCPGCINDWNVLARFSDVCRVFIFCSKTKRRPTENFPIEGCPEFMQALFSFRYAGAQGDLDPTVFGKAGLLPDCRSGYYRWLWRKVNAKVQDFSIERRMLAVFLNIDPVQAYTDLFIKRNVAPKYVSLLNCGWQHPIRDTLLQAGQAQPRYLVAEWPGVYAPWTSRRREMRTWGSAAVFARRTDPPHPAIALRQRDNLELTNERLTPTTINGADSLLVSLQDYLAYAWPQPNLKIFIDSTDERAVAEIRAHDCRVERLPVHGRPLCEVLPVLARACVGQCIHSNVLGLEDEAEGILRAWPGIYKNLHLVIHGESADWASLDWEAAPDLHYPGLPTHRAADAP
jgi:hypothetical protein